MNNQEDLKPVLGGDLAFFPALEIVALIHEGKKSGKLEVSQLAKTKRVFFQDGEVIFATSNLEEDRLGESLIRSGRITGKQYKAVSKSLEPGQKIGKKLVQEGILTPGRLWIGVKNQIEEIFYSVLKFKTGHFSFYEGKPRLNNTVRLSRSVRALIFEGVRQIDEFKVFVEKVINQKTVFLPLGRPADLKLTDIEDQVFQLVDGQKSVREIIGESSSSPFVTLKVLSNLMLSKVILPKDLLGSLVAPQEELVTEEIEVEVATDEMDAMPVTPMPEEITIKPIEINPDDVDDLPPVEVVKSEPKEEPKTEDVHPDLELIRRYNKIFSEVHRTMEDFDYSVGDDVKEYFNDHESPFVLLIFQLEWLEGGGLDENILMDRVSRMDPQEGSNLLRRAMEDMLMFMLFKSKEFLPKEFSDTLFETVQELQELI